MNFTTLEELNQILLDLADKQRADEQVLPTLDYEGPVVSEELRKAIESRQFLYDSEPTKQSN